MHKLTAFDRPGLELRFQADPQNLLPPQAAAAAPKLVSSDQFIARGVEGRSWAVREGIPPSGELAVLGELGGANTGTVFDPSLGIKHGAAEALILPLRKDAQNLGKDSSLLLVRMDPLGTHQLIAKVEHGSAVASDGRYLYVLQRPYYDQPGAILKFDPLGTDCPPEGQKIFESKTLPNDPGMTVVGGNLVLVGGRAPYKDRSKLSPKQLAAEDKKQAERDREILYVEPKAQKITTIGQLPKALSHPTVVQSKIDGVERLVVVGGLDSRTGELPKAQAEVLVYQRGMAGVELKEQLTMTDGTKPTGAASPSVIPLENGNLWVSGGWDTGLSGAASAGRMSHEIHFSPSGTALSNGSTLSLPDTATAFYGPTSSVGVLPSGTAVFHRGFELGELKLPPEKTKEQVGATINLLTAFFETNVNVDASTHLTIELLEQARKACAANPAAGAQLIAYLEMLAAGPGQR